MHTVGPILIARIEARCMFREKMGRGEVQAQCSATVVAIELVGADGGRRTADADEGGHACMQKTRRAIH